MRRRRCCRCSEHSDLYHRRRKIDIILLCGFCWAADAAAARRTYKINARRVSISDGDGGGSSGGGRLSRQRRYLSCNKAVPLTHRSPLRSARTLHRNALRTAMIFLVQKCNSIRYICKHTHIYIYAFIRTYIYIVCAGMIARGR